MRRLITLSLSSVIILAMHGAACAQSAPPEEHRQVLPVLVKMDSKGEIAHLSPATRLPMKLQRLLRNNLDEIVAGPGNDRLGHSGSGQFIANMALDVTPIDDDTQSVHFVLVSTQPVAAGSWIWSQANGGQPTLVNRDRQLIHTPLPDPKFRTPTQVPNSSSIAAK